MIGQSAGKSFAYVLGVYLGDGCTTITGRTGPSGTPCFQLGTIDRDFAEATAEALREISDKNVRMNVYAVKKSPNPNHIVCVCDAELYRVLREDTEQKRVIPGYVWEWSRENRLAFIVGLMDSEGFVAKKTGGTTGRSYYMGFKSCDPWVPDFIRLLHGVGIQTGKMGVEKPRMPGYKTPRRFHIKMQSWVDSGARFNIARKQDRVDDWAATEPYSQRSRHPRKLTSTTNMPDTPRREDRV